jgi:L-asparaginase II
LERLFIEARRGAALEGRHEVSAVLARADGAVVRRVGPPITTTWRSAAKPFQLETTLGLVGEAEAPFSQESLALGASSHSAQPAHVRGVESLLARLGLGPEALYCGAHWPMHGPSTQALWRVGAPCTALHNNCSGKHGFMAAAARALGAPPDYRPDDHPVQRAIRATIDARTGGVVEGTVVDGCGVPCFVLPIDGMATAYAQLAVATRARAGALGEIGAAMLAAPWFVSGDDRVDGTLMEASTRPLIAKVGAAALLCVALPGEGLGLALKVHTADDDARAVAIDAVLARWFPGLVPEGALAESRRVRNVVGALVGARSAIWA